MQSYWMKKYHSKLFLLWLCMYVGLHAGENVCSDVRFVKG